MQALNGIHLMTQYYITDMTNFQNKSTGDPITAIGQNVGEWMRNGKSTAYGRLYDQGAAIGSLSGGATGALAGIGIQGLLNIFRKDTEDDYEVKTDAKGKPYYVKKNKYLIPGLIGGIAGGTLGGWVGHERSKAASVIDSKSYVLDQLSRANDLTPSQYQEAYNKVLTLNSNSLNDLASLLKSSIGFGLGAIIFKYLFSTNTVGTILGGIIGMRAFGNSSNEQSYKLNDYGRQFYKYR